MWSFSNKVSERCQQRPKTSACSLFSTWCLNSSYLLIFFTLYVCSAFKVDSECVPLKTGPSVISLFQQLFFSIRALIDRCDALPCLWANSDKRRGVRGVTSRSGVKRALITSGYSGADVVWASLRSSGLVWFGDELKMLLLLNICVT